MRVSKTIKDSQKMIRWRLRILMAEKKITNKGASPAFWHSSDFYFQAEKC